MTLEEALIELGDQPLAKSAYSTAIKAVVNATLNDPEKMVTLTSTGGMVLTTVYQLADVNTRTTLLNKDLGKVRDKDYYRLFILGLAVMICFIAIALVLNVTLGENGQADNSTGLLRLIITETFDLIKNLLGSDQGNPPS